MLELELELEEIVVRETQEKPTRCPGPLVEENADGNHSDTF